MKKQIIPSHLFWFDYNRLTIDKSKKLDFKKMYSEENCEYVLSLKTKRTSILVRAGVPADLSVKGTFNISAPDNPFLTLWLFEYYTYPTPHFYVFPCKKLVVENGGTVDLTTPDQTKDFTKDQNTSPLEEIETRSPLFNVRLEGFKKLKKFFFNCPRKANSLYHVNTIKLIDCEAIEEIDLSKLPDLYGGLKFDIIQNYNGQKDITIKLPCEAMKELSCFYCVNNNKKRFTICFCKNGVMIPQNKTVFTCSNDIFDKYNNNGMIEIKLSELKKLFKNPVVDNSHVK